MKSGRIAAIVIGVLLFIFNEWAFRFIFPLEPIDSFLRLMTLVLDGFVLAFVLVFLRTGESFSGRTKKLLQYRPKVVATYAGLFISYCLIMAVEFSCRYYFKHIYEAPYAEQTYWEPSAIVRDSILGSSLGKNTEISHAYVVNDSLIYKQLYLIDRAGRRITPVTRPDSTYQEFAMITGCSFAFGYGLDEHQTLSYHLDSLIGYRGYNYGVAGHGTQQTLALLQSRDLNEEISEENGMLVHLFIDDHIPRLIGSRRLIKLWATNFPYYYLEGEELKRDGSFWTGRHIQTRFYRAISQSAFIDLFDIDFPWYVSNDHLKLFGAVLEQAKQEFTVQYPSGNFLVVIGPNSTLANKVKNELGRRDINVLDLSGLLNKEQKQYKIHWTEGHPNEKYYEALASQIKAYLQATEDSLNVP